MMLRGFDVSHYQGNVDWAALKKAHDLTWGAAKVTEAEGGRDAQFPANWRKLKEAGLIRAGYHFAHPDSDPRDDAKGFLDYVKAAGGFERGDIAVMDMEANQLGLPLLQVRDWLAKWADIVTAATGRRPFLYCGSGYIRNNATLGLRQHYAAWWYPKYPTAWAGKTAWPDSIVGYPAKNNWGGAPDIWQFSQSFGGHNRDANVANMTLADLQTRGAKSTKPTTPPPVQEDDMPYTEQQLEQFAGVGVHGQKLGRSDVTIGAAIDVTYKNSNAIKAQLVAVSTQVAGLSAAVKALAEAKDIDPAAIIAAVTDATDKAATAALADLKITLSTEQQP